jgi:hypothetical protein
LVTVALDPHKKVVILVTDAPAHQQCLVFENMTSVPSCTTFIQTVMKHNL